LLRIAGAAAGPALVAMVLQRDESAYATTFGIACAVVLAGLAATVVANRPQLIAKPT